MLKVSLILGLWGLGFVLLSAGADVFGLDITPGIGLMQTLGVLLGLTMLAGAGFSFLSQLRPPGKKIPLLSDIGIRMALTGLLACYVSGLADMVGVGTHQAAQFERPFLGPLQLIGFGLGLLVVLSGLGLYGVGMVRGDAEIDA